MPGSRHVVGQKLHKLAFYGSQSLSTPLPWSLWSQRRDRILAALETLTREDRRQIMERVRYYNRLSSPFVPGPGAKPIASCDGRGQSSAYYYDLRNLIRYFPRRARVDYAFGDITTVPETPQFVKSRPIDTVQNNRNSVLLKLNSVRHYRLYQDHLGFDEKKPVAVWRGKSNHPDRVALAQRYARDPLFDIGCVRHKETTEQPYLKPFMPVPEQLRYQFILSVEGVDVATNLKWIMASNSLCLMRKPRFETWYMEGLLQPGVHYVELKDDFSNLHEKVAYYRQHPQAAKLIIANANAHAARFRDDDAERLVSLLVMDRYLRLAGEL